MCVAPVPWQGGDEAMVAIAESFGAIKKEWLGNALSSIGFLSGDQLAVISRSRA